MLSLSRTVLNRKNLPYKTDKGNSGYYDILLHESGSWQSQRMDLAKNTLQQLRQQGTERWDDITTTTSSAQVSGRLLIGVTRKPETRSDTTRVFHGIYATTTS